MKLSNCVVGQVIEAKRDVKGYHNVTIPRGLQVLVGMLQLPAIDEYPVRVDHDSFSDGYEWVNPADFRKVKEVKEVEQVDAVPYDVQKGTKVICVHGFVEPRFSDYFKEGVVYVVRQDGLDHDGELRLEHPSLGGGHGYGKPQHFRLYKEPQETVKEPVVEPKSVVQEKLPPTYIQVGDYILSSGRDPELEADTLYEVVQVDPRHIGISLHTSSVKVWQECYCLVMSDFSKVLREVQPDVDMTTTEPASILVGCTVRVKEDVVARHGENIPKGTTGVVASIRDDNGQYIVYSPIGWLGQFTVDKDVLEQVEGDADTPTA